MGTFLMPHGDIIKVARQDEENRTKKQDEDTAFRPTNGKAYF
jgi:hypothetical protein